MNQRESISAVMTSDPITVERTQPLSEVYGLLKQASFHHLPVIEGDDLVGVVAASDILRLVYDVDGSDERELKSFLDYQFTIDDAMSVDLRTLLTSATIQDAAAVLSDGSLHSVLVVDDAGALAGIVTSTDLIRHLASGA